LKAPTPPLLVDCSSDGKIRDILSAKTYKGFKGVSLSKKELLEELSGGCAWCELEFIAVTDKFAWVDDAKPVCHKCLVGEPDTKTLDKAILH